MPSMERQRFGDRIVVGGRMRADLLELADVVLLRGGGRHQRPQRRDLLAPHVEEAGADRRQQPLVQAGAVVVAAEIRALNGKCAKACAPSTIGLDAAAPRLVADPLHRKDLAGEIRDVAEVQDLRRRRDRARAAIGEVVHAIGGTGNEIFVSMMPSRRTRCSQVSSMRP